MSRHHSIYLGQRNITVDRFEANDGVLDVEDFLQPKAHPLVEAFVSFDLDPLHVGSVSERYHK